MPLPRPRCHLPFLPLTLLAASTLTLLGLALEGRIPALAALALVGLLVASFALALWADALRGAPARARVATAELSRRRQGEQRLLRMIEEMPVAVMTLDPETGRISYMNQTCDRLLREVEEYLPVAVDDVVGSSMDVFHRSPARQQSIVSLLQDSPHSARIRLGPETLDLQVSSIPCDEGAGGPMVVWSNVTKELAAELRILDLAHHDSLTGLNNRTTFSDQVEARIASPAARTALLFVDLDGFKGINDNLGHHAGDTVIRTVATRLQAICSPHDAIVGRLGGDEFGIFLADADRAAATGVARTVIDALGAPYPQVRGSALEVSASIGIATTPTDGTTCSELLLRADIALYHAKAAGKAKAVAFEAEMEESIHHRAELITDLREAITADRGIEVHFQDIVEIASMRVTAREALARWHHPRLGTVPPSTFITLAEQSGLIDVLGRLIARRAFAEARWWEERVRLAVNVSAGQLGRGTFVEEILGLLVSSGLAPERLEIEVTETALLSDHEGVLRELSQLRGAGVRVSLDDFGTGYSSLTHLRDFPFDTIKIDGSFVREAATNPSAAAIVRAIAELGIQLGVTTVAEGVESSEQLDLVTRAGCIEVQGYLISRPIPAQRSAGSKRLSTACSSRP
ncbi:EAL domain-containing protein [Nocardioides sp.]|uniref:putative bifunctional diguanylate cyclase/phosphodiesterase n=1 Tax=Nocardioides sp. TaxID=35761 RepID=UPI00262DECAF|nr:EAL domain-containing protein [Nocardioides sp.]